MGLKCIEVKPSRKSDIGSLDALKTMKDNRRVSRRSLLRTALVGGSGLAAAALVGCGDNNRSGTTSAGTETGATSPTTPTGRTTPEPTLALPRWGRLPDTGKLPSPRRDHSLVTDGQRLYLFGGRDSTTLGDFWVYDLGSGQWTEVTSAAPPARFGHNAAYDAPGSRILVFGGQANGFFNDIWAYRPTTGTWERLPAAGTTPAARYGAASAADPAGRVIVSHGFTDTGRFDDSWAFGGPSGNAWADISPAGERPIKRCLTRGVWDAARSGLLMFGGQTDSAPFLGDTWRLEDEGWKKLTPGRSPPPRNLYAMVWDDDRSRALLFGGRTEGGPVNDLWAFDGASNSWSELATQAEPPTPRHGQDAVWLPGKRSLVVFAGQDANGSRNDLWELDFRG